MPVHVPAFGLPVSPRVEHVSVYLGLQGHEMWDPFSLVAICLNIDTGSVSDKSRQALLLSFAAQRYLADKDRVPFGALNIKATDSASFWNRT